MKQGIATSDEKYTGEGADPLYRKMLGASHVPTMTKPFDVHAEGLVFEKNRGDGI